jgi:DNA uptake protein ComE-like DNA-binding protein
MKKVFALLAVALASAGIAFAQAPAKVAKKPDAAKEAAAPKADAKKAALTDINTATPKELATLPGIGDARAAAIVKGRPFKGKDDLVQKKILTQAVYDGIKDQIIAKQY